MHKSQDSGCLAIIGAGGYKLREPHLEYFTLEGIEGSSDFLACPFVKPGLADVAVHTTLDESRSLIFLAYKYRIKYFSWATANDENREEALPTHTLASAHARGPFAVLPNGSVIRAGIGEVAVWNIDSLPTHGANGRKTIGRKDMSISENAWRDDSEDIELSTGSPATSRIQLTGNPGLSISRWKLLAQASWTIVCQTNQYGCTTIDLEHGGSIVARYLGHGGHLADLAVSDGDPQVFLTTCSDRFARMFDKCTSLPVLTFDACQNTESCDAAVLVHLDGIPTIFTGTTRGEQINMRDVRARTPVYELATGNNSVQALAWDTKRNCLDAATECKYYNWMGFHHEYRYAKRDVGRTPDSDDESEDEDEDYVDHG